MGCREGEATVSEVGNGRKRLREEEERGEYRGGLVDGLREGTGGGSWKGECGVKGRGCS